MSLPWLPLAVVLVDVVVLALLLLLTLRLQRGPVVRLHSRGFPVHAYGPAAPAVRACAGAQ